MAPDPLRELLRRQPFQPFRIHLSNGQTFDVQSPEWMMVTRQTTALGIPGESGDGDRLRLIDNDHIAHVEPIDAEQVH